MFGWPVTRNVISFTERPPGGGYYWALGQIIQLTFMYPQRLESVTQMEKEILFLIALVEERLVFLVRWQV